MNTFHNFIVHNSLHSKRRGKRLHSTPAEKRSNTTNITTGDDFVPISDANVDINVGRLVRSAPEEQKQVLLMPGIFRLNLQA
jgi:hypothetical protein